MAAPARMKARDRGRPGLEVVAALNLTGVDPYHDLGTGAAVEPIVE